MSTHHAVCTVAIRAPLEIRQVPTVPPADREVRLRNEWTASTPLDLHQADGGLLVQHPMILGDGVAGTVVEVGPNVKNLALGDKVFGFTWRKQQEKAYQEFVTVPEYLLAKVPNGFSLQEAVTVPNNLVTVFHTCSKDLGIELPWPKPKDFVPAHAHDPFLIWGGSSSVGQYAIQILRYFGFTNLFVAASKAHHESLKALGASQCFDYREPDVPSSVLKAAKATGVGEGQPSVRYILDCIGSVSNSVAPIAKIAQNGAKVAMMLPFIVKDASETEPPEYSMDAQAVAQWQDGVEASGVRTHFYLEVSHGTIWTVFRQILIRSKNGFFKEHLQSEIVPYLLEKKIVVPNKQRIVEGSTLLERAQKALDILRRREVSGERLVWQVAS